jgi:hypothetical protein
MVASSHPPLTDVMIERPCELLHMDLVGLARVRSTGGKWYVSYGPPWAHYLGGYQDQLLCGPLGLPDLRCTAPDGVKHKDYRGEVLG